jgi:hypothetical protein
MKNIALPLMASICLFFASCSGNHPSKDSGQDQVPGPVQNSGPETEAARATHAVQDTSELKDKKDTVATSNDHRH